MLMEFFLRRTTILALFVITALLGALSAPAGQEAHGALYGILACIVLPLLAWFTYKRQLLATWCTVVLLLINGSGLLYDSILGVTGRMDISFLMIGIKGLAGIYLTWGALVIHRQRHIQD